MAKSLVADLSKQASIIADKQARLHEMWPSIFVDIVKEAVVDMWDLEGYVKKQQKQFDEV